MTDYSNCESFLAEEQVSSAISQIMKKHKNHSIQILPFGSGYKILEYPEPAIFKRKELENI